MRIGHTAPTRLLLLGALYFAQGVPWGFITVTVTLHLTKLGFDGAHIGSLLSIAYLPWAGKPFLGPFVDAANFGRFGRRRPIIVAAELGMAASVIALAAVDPRAAWSGFLALMFAHNAFGAFQDVATDGLAIALLPERERGTANGVMAAAKYAGVWVGGPGLALVAASADWTHLAPLVAALLLAPGVLLLFLDEPAPEAPAEAAVGDRVRAIARTLRSAFATRAAWLGAALALTITAADGLLQPMLMPLLRRDLGFGEGRVGELFGISTGVAAAFSLAGGFLSDRLGRRRALVLAMLGGIACNLVLVVTRAYWSSFAFMQIVFAVSAAFTGIVYAGMLALFMDLTRPQIGATHFQIYMSLINLCSVWASTAGGRLTGFLSPAQMFLLAAVVGLVPLALLTHLQPEPRRVSAK